MRSYPALKTLSIIVKVFTVLFALSGTILSISLMDQRSSFGSSAEVFGAISLVSTAAISLLLWALSEILVVFANMGEDISNYGGKMSISLATLVSLWSKTENIPLDPISLNSLTTRSENAAPSDNSMEMCPFCGEPTKKENKKCEICNKLKH